MGTTFTSMTIITFLVGLIPLIISIIVLVKFFQVTADVKFLKEIILDEKDGFEFLVANGYKDEAKRKLLRIVWDDSLMEPLKDEPTKDIYDLHYPKIKEKYQQKFAWLGEEFPTYEVLINRF